MCGLLSSSLFPNLIIILIFFLGYSQDTWSVITFSITDPAKIGFSDRHRSDFSFSLQSKANIKTR